MSNSANNLIAKAKAAASPQELLSFAKENGLCLSDEQADAYFKWLKECGEVSDDELDNVTGGGCGKEPPFDIDVYRRLYRHRPTTHKCPTCGSPMEKFAMPDGEIIICTFCGRSL